MGESAKTRAEQRRLNEEFINDEEEDIQEEDGPPVIDPYEELGLEQDATADDVKKAYRKLALKYHPDKAPEAEKDAANKKFQEIAFAYAVLSDDRRRKRYDLTGSTAETLEDDDEFDWLKFYRKQFEDIVNDEAIEKISNEYKGSDEERKALINAYKKYKGRLDSMYQSIMLSDILVDDDRFRQIIDEEISLGSVESYPDYERETDETRQKAKEVEKKRREEFDKRSREKQEETTKTAPGKAKVKAKSKKNDPGNMGDLAALIQQRQKARSGNFFDNLEAKYAPKSRGSKRATPMEEPPEEAFQATAERGKRRKQNRRAKQVQDDEDEEMEMGEDNIEESEEEDEQDEAPRKSRKSKPAKKGRGRASAKA